MNRIPRTLVKRGLGQLSLGLLVGFLTAPSAWAEANSPAAFELPGSNVSTRGRLRDDGTAFSQSAVPQVRPSKLDRLGAAPIAGTDSVATALAVEIPPAICSGYGSLESISFTNWESGLGAWTVRTDAVNSGTFDTDDWAVVGSLPDGRAGMAAFVANLDTGNCSTDDEAGVLFLESPPIVIPAGTEVPRVAFDHWFAIERGWDGGNLKLNVNGGGFQLIPTTAIEFNTYTGKLYAADEDNTNPLASQPAYTGIRGDTVGAWEQVWVNLNGLAKAGDSIVLRFDFGIDGCDGLVGWYVDDVRVYSCSDELQPSDCGNGVLDAGEQCDDGNNYIDDGCSNTCQVEFGWECTDPLPPGEILDGGFEAGTPNPNWGETSTNFDTPICDEVACGLGTGTGPASGDYWAWFGGIEIYEASSLSQSITIPTSSSVLTFELEASTCDSGSDYLEVRVDNIRKFLIDGSSPLCESVGYSTQEVDISEFADGKAHSLLFRAETFAANFDVTNFFVDNVAIPGAPSECERLLPTLTLKKVVTNNNGGTAVPSNWTLAANGPTPISGPGPTVMSGTNFLPGTYQLQESGGPAGYSAGNWTCVGGSQPTATSVTLEPGESATCTIINDDMPPSLTLVKKVINDDGGSGVPADWTLSALGPTSISGSGPNVSSGADFRAGTYHLSEGGGPGGYTASAWVCNGGVQSDSDTIILAIGQSATCTITNDDIDPSSIVLKDGFEAK